MRTFENGATRDNDAGKLDYEGFNEPEVERCYAEYMHKHRTQADGELRPSDNWQGGMPRACYIKSGYRHFMDWWTLHRRDLAAEEPPTNAERLEQIDALCALRFNVNGYLYEMLNGR